MSDDLEEKAEENGVKKKGKIVFGGSVFVNGKGGEGVDKTNENSWFELQDRYGKKINLSRDVAKEAWDNYGYGPGDYVEYEIKIKPKKDL